MAGGNLPDGVNQSDIDRSLESGDEGKTPLEVAFDDLDAQADKSNALIDKLRAENKWLLEELKRLSRDEPGF